MQRYCLVVNKMAFRSLPFCNCCYAMSVGCLVMKALKLLILKEAQKMQKKKL